MSPLYDSYFFLTYHPSVYPMVKRIHIIIYYIGICIYNQHFLVILHKFSVIYIKNYIILYMKKAPDSSLHFEMNREPPLFNTYLPNTPAAPPKTAHALLFSQALP